MAVRLTFTYFSYSRCRNFGGLDFRCVLWLNDTPLVSKEVNRKCPHEHDGTTFNPLHEPWAPQCTASQMDGQTTIGLWRRNGNWRVVQNPLPAHTFSRNFPVDGATSRCNRIWETTKHRVNTLARTNLLRTCYGETGVTV